MSYYTESLKPRSEKITLVTCDAVERLKLFTLVGSDYERVVDNFIVGVKDSGTSLIEGTIPLSLNQWNYNPLTKTLSVNVGSDPKTKDISVTYRLFYSNAPINLPYDLNTGEVVEWLPYISSVASIGQQLDSENTGIVLESNSSVDLFNSDGHFDNIYDRYIFENQSIKFYSWFPTIPISERVQLFDGVIESKTFTDSKVTLRVKDFVYRLKNKVNLGLFSDADGIILPSILGTAKRRIYGQADHVKCVSLDATLDGYPLSGSISGNISSDILLGVGTFFLDEVSPGDDLFIILNNVSHKIGVISVDSNTQVTTTSILSIGFSGASLKNKPKINWRKKNRTWQIANHKLRSPSVLITSVESPSLFVVSSTVDFFSGDTILINGIQSTIRLISGNKIQAGTNIIPIPVIGNSIVKRPISKATINTSESLYSRDYTYTNTTYSNVIFDPLAEFNMAEQSIFNINFTFTNSSRSISTSSMVDLRSVVTNRDWIKSGNVSHTEWYEILEVKEQSIILRTSFAYPTTTGSAYYKNIEYINEESLITVNCIGMEFDGKWIKTASDAARNLVLNDAGFLNLNEASFIKANADCDYILSLVIPDKIGGPYTMIRDELTKICQSVFGALYVDVNHAISFSIFNSKKPESLASLKDDDILSFSVESTQNIINESKVNYSPYVDVYSGNNAFKTTTHISSFVNNLIGIKSTYEKTIYLYEDDKAEILAQRLCFFKSLENSIVTLKTKMNLSTTVINDKIYLSLDRLFKRYAGNDRRRLGVVSGIKKGEFGCEISISDLGNIYNRVMSIAPNSALEYLSSSDDDKIKWCYLVDTNTNTPDPLSENGLGSYLIG
jgi:hypothetical protein